jgi:MoxR-like ATPase
MATATRTLLDTWKDIFGEGGFLAKHNVERDEEIEILGLCTTSGVDGLLLGEPGVGKTWMIELLLQCLPGAELFNTLIMKEMSADEVLGPRSLKALKDDRLVRLTLGFMPEANFAYLDEIFKGPPPVLNALLSLMAERKLKFAGKVIDCSQLISIIMSSNELPEREDLLAMRDRIGLTKFVQAVRSPEGKRQVADIQIDFIERGGLDLSDIPRLELADLHAMRAEAMATEVPEPVRNAMVEAHGRWQEAGFLASQRRMGQMWRMMKTLAWSKGRDHLTTDDMMICQHMAWNSPEHVEKAREIVTDYAGSFTQAAVGHRDAMEPILKKADEALVKLADEDEATHDAGFDEGWEALRDLRRLRDKIRNDIQNANEQGHDARELERVLEEVQRAHKHTKARLDKDDPAAEDDDD